MTKDNIFNILLGHNCVLYKATKITSSVVQLQVESEKSKVESWKLKERHAASGSGLKVRSSGVQGSKINS